MDWETFILNIAFGIIMGAIHDSNKLGKIKTFCLKLRDAINAAFPA